MTCELVVLSPKPLPTSLGFLVRCGDVEVNELLHGTDVQLGFEPRGVLSVTAQTHFKAHSVAAALACALNGVVFDAAQGKVSFDGRTGRPTGNLVDVIRRACIDADGSWRAIELAHTQARLAQQALLAAVEPLAHGA